MAASDLVAQIIDIIAKHRGQIRDLLTQETPFEDGLLPIEGGGTGAGSASGALSALGAAAASHQHSAADITSGTLAAARLGASPSSTKLLFGDQTWSTLTASDIPSLDASKITSGTLATARLGSGSAASSNFLRGDGTWTNSLSGTFSCSSINTGGPAWDLGARTAAGDAVSNGYVTVTIDGTAYKLSTRA